jgi:hypothetical protein
MITAVRASNECKALPVTDHGASFSCETSRLPHFLDNWFKDCGEVFSLTRLPPFTPLTKIPGTHFSQKLSSPQGHRAARRIRKLRNRTRISRLEAVIEVSSF